MFVLSLTSVGAAPLAVERRLSSRSASAAPARLAAQPRRSTPSFKRSAPSCAASVGATRFVTGAGRVGSASFTPPPPAKKSSSKFLIVFTLFGIVLPTVGAIAVALCSPVCTALGDVLHSLLPTLRIARRRSRAVLSSSAPRRSSSRPLRQWLTWWSISGSRCRCPERGTATACGRPPRWGCSPRCVAALPPSARGQKLRCPSPEAPIAHRAASLAVRRCDRHLAATCRPTRRRMRTGAHRHV